MKPILLLLLAGLVFTLTGCSSPESTGGTTPPAEPSGRQPAHKAVRQLTKKMLAKVEGEIKGLPSPPLIVIRPVDNETTQSLNTFAITDQITGEIKSSHLFRFEQADYATQEEPDPNTDYVVTGKLQEVKTLSSSGQIRGQSLKLFLNLINFKNGQLVWMGDTDM